jgi:DNA-binding response OmpR family regulator
MNQNSKKILIVEDDKDFLWILKKGFEHKGFVLLYALDGQEGLAIAQKENPDVMIIDIDLPKMDGITMAKKIKESGVNSRMIFLTNFRDSEHIGEALSVTGGADYIIKADMRVDEIIVRVKNKLGIK